MLNELLRAVQDQEVEHFVGGKFVGAYEGEGNPDNKRSVTLHLEYRAADRTLRDEEVEQRHADLTASLLQTFGAERH